VLDGKLVNRISAFLFDSNIDADPKPLASNASLAFMGFYPYGSGFTFDDSEPDATPIAEMHRILAVRPHSSNAIFPYIGGEEFLEDPRQLHRCYAIFFGNMAEGEARANYPELMAIVEDKVKPFRLENKRSRLSEEWWLYGEQRPGLQAASRDLPKVLMHPNLSTHLAFAYVPRGTMVASPHYAFTTVTWSAFAILQSRVHEIWARFFASSLEDRLRYTGAVCAETFPFSKQYVSDRGRCREWWRAPCRCSP
jgi:hypothetical protein